MRAPPWAIISVVYGSDSAPAVAAQTTVHFTTSVSVLLQWTVQRVGPWKDQSCGEKPPPLLPIPSGKAVGADRGEKREEGPCRAHGEDVATTLGHPCEVKTFLNPCRPFQYFYGLCVLTLALFFLEGFSQYCRSAGLAFLGKPGNSYMLCKSVYIDGFRIEFASG